jgi:hypothetical protein
MVRRAESLPITRLVCFVILFLATFSFGLVALSW